MKLVDAIHRLKVENDRGITFYHGDDSEEYFSYAQLYRKAQKMLSYFREHGIEKGNELIILLDNNVNIVITIWACLLGGIVCLPFATNERSIVSLDKCLNLCKHPSCIIDGNIRRSLRNLGLESKYNIIDYPQMAHLEEMDATMQYAETTDDDVVLVLFSSGSTSEPKGTAMTNRNLMAYLQGYTVFYSKDDIFLTWLPFTHNSGIMMSHFTPVFLGAPQYLVHPSLMMKNAAKMMEIITEKRIDVSGTIRLHILQLIEIAKKNPNLNWDLSSIKAFVIGGEPVSFQELEDFIHAMETYGFNREAMACAYGMSETVSGVIRTKREKAPSHIWIDRRTMQVHETLPSENDNHSKYLSSVVSVGEPEKGLQVMIRSKDNKTALNEDQIGTIYLKGNQVIDEYYGIEGGLLKDNEGWLNTEDVGLIHKSELYIMGREKNMIFVNSKNVFCDDIALIVSETLGLNREDISFVCIPSSDNTKNDLVICFKKADSVDEEFVECSKAIRKNCMETFGIKINTYIAMKEFPHTEIGKIKVGELQKRFISAEYPEEMIYRYSEKYDHANCETLEYLQDILLRIFRKYCNLDVNDNFFDYLHDSLEVAKIHTEVDELYPEVLEIADFFNYYSVQKLSSYMLEQLKNN